MTLHTHVKQIHLLNKCAFDKLHIMAVNKEVAGGAKVPVVIQG